MAARIFYQEDCNLSVLEGQKIAIIGYGSQGHAHALNLKESGCDVIVGLYEGSKSWAKAEAQGLEVFTAAEAAKQADIIMILINDELQADMYKKDIEPNLEEGNMLMFAHGFNIHFGCIVPPKNVDVTMIAPKGPGHTVRSEYQAGKGVPCLVAVQQDATGKAEERTMAMGIGIGSGYMFKTTFTRETYSDLTGERGALMGAVQGMFLAQYETLRSHGHTPSEAFNETVEEFTQSLLPMVGKNGMDWMYANCSTTAQRGALDWMGPFHDAIKPVMEKLYESVATGNEAQISIDSNSKPDYREKLNKELEAIHNSEMWRTGETVRKLRPENN